MNIAFERLYNFHTQSHFRNDNWLHHLFAREVYFANKLQNHHTWRSPVRSTNPSWISFPRDLYYKYNLYV